jgi:hypothetical protein
MRKKLYAMITIVLLLSVMLSSCVNTGGLKILKPDNSKPDEYYSSMNQGGQIAFSYLNTPYGKYQNIGGFVYYSQYGNTEFKKLCTKEDCDHSTNECDSFVGNEIGYNTHIGYYNDKIYFTEFVSDMTLKLMSMDMFGKNHEVVKTIAADYDMASYISYGCFHNGYYYFLVTEGGSLGAVGNKDDNFYRIKLDSKSEYEKVFRDDVISEISMFTIVGDKVFFYVNKTGINPTDYYNLKSDSIDFDLYMLSLEDNKFEHMTDKWAEYTNCYYDAEKGYCYKHNDGFYTLDLATKQMNKVSDSVIEGGWRSVANYYEDNIYVITFTNTKDDRGYDLFSNSQTLYIFDKQYTLLDTYNGEFTGTTLGNMIDDTGDFIVISSNYKYPPDYYINKSDIGEGIILHKIGE